MYRVEKTHSGRVCQFIFKCKKRSERQSIIYYYFENQQFTQHGGLWGGGDWEDVPPQKKIFLSIKPQMTIEAKDFLCKKKILTTAQKLLKNNNLRKYVFFIFHKLLLECILNTKYFFISNKTKINYSCKKKKKKKNIQLFDKIRKMWNLAFFRQQHLALP